MKKLLFLLLMLPMLGFSQRDMSDIEIKSTEMAPGIYRLYIGDGVAMIAYYGDDGLLVIDAAYEQTSEKVMNELESLGGNNIHYLINTHQHGDHTGGNKVIGKDADIISHHHVKDFVSKDRGEGESKQEAFPDYARPNISFSDSMTMRFNDQTLTLIHLPGGHTGGDIIIYFPDSKVLAAGDLLFADRFPYVDIQNGGNPFRYIENGHWIAKNFPHDVTIIGGHGPVYSMDEFKEHNKILEKTIGVIKKAKEKGKSLEQMQEEQILEKWEEYGWNFISEDKWIETIYGSLE
ncbi:MAG: MBL fold metallo-hydrolase [Bacteroidales bacterium]